MSTMAPSSTAHYCAATFLRTGHRIEAWSQCGGDATLHVAHLPESGATIGKLGRTRGSCVDDASWDGLVCIAGSTSSGATVSFSSHAICEWGGDCSRVVLLATATDLPTSTLPTPAEALLLSCAVLAPLQRRVSCHRSRTECQDYLNREPRSCRHESFAELQLCSASLHRHHLGSRPPFHRHICGLANLRAFISQLLEYNLHHDSTFFKSMEKVRRNSISTCWAGESRASKTSIFVGLSRAIAATIVSGALTDSDSAF